MLSIAAKPASKAELIRRTRAAHPNLSEDELMAKLGVSRTQVRQAIGSQGLALRRGLRP